MEILYRLWFFLVVVVCGFIAHVSSQNCVPNAVTQVDVTNRTLTWTGSDNCIITHYIIYVRNGTSVMYIYEQNETTLDISFLPFCGIFRFVITPIAYHLVGADAFVEFQIAPPSDTVIEIESINASRIGDDLLLRWSVNADYQLCADFYHLLIWSSASAAPIETYAFSDGYLIENTAPCTEYVVNIAVSYQETVGPTKTLTYDEPATKVSPPQLQQIYRSTTSVSTSWVVEPYERNRCNIVRLIANGRSNFNLSIPVLDTPQRPPIFVNITNLRPNSMYLFSLTVENTAGYSDPVPLAVQTL